MINNDCLLLVYFKYSEGFKSQRYKIADTAFTADSSICQSLVDSQSILKRSSRSKIRNMKEVLENREINGVQPTNSRDSYENLIKKLLITLEPAKDGPAQAL